MLFITGDTHRKVVDRFSFKQHPELRSARPQDVIFQLGDFGQPFGLRTYKEARYTFRFLDEKPWTTIVVGGNHDDYDYWESCPQVELFGGVARQAQFQEEKYSVFFVDQTTIFDIENNHILCIPKAQSHDIWNLLDPDQPDFKFRKRSLRKDNLWFRVKHESWWPQEKIDIEKNIDFMKQHEQEHFDLILSHDAPSLITEWFIRQGMPIKPTEGERYLEMLRKVLDFDCWIHGHFHFDGGWDKTYDDRMHGIYQDIIQLVE
jgi:predicted phosphodiesterase